MAAKRYTRAQVSTLQDQLYARYNELGEREATARAMVGGVYPLTLYGGGPYLVLALAALADEPAPEVVADSP